MLSSSARRLPSAMRTAAARAGTGTAVGDPTIASARLAEFYFSSSSASAAGSETVGKPPNVLLFAGDDGAEDLLREAEGALKSVLSPDGCLVYRLSAEDAKSTPWSDNVRALVALRESRCPEVKKVISDFLTSGDSKKAEKKCLLWSEDPFSLFSDGGASGDDGAVSVKSGDVVSPEGSSLVVYRSSAALADKFVLRRIFSHFFNLPTISDADGEGANTPALTPGYLVCQDEAVSRQLSQSSNADAPFRTPVYSSRSGDDVSPSADAVPVYTAERCPSFDADLFLSHLNTRCFGRVLVHVPVVGSSFDLMGKEAPLLLPGRSLAVVPDRQTAGRGRGGNGWISPPGCAMFSLQFRVEPESNLAARASFLCHLTALSVVHATKSLLSRGGVELDVGIKWPNDVYLNGKDKIGGVLLYNNPSPEGSMVLSLGVGVNLDNRLPTVSLNGEIRRSAVGTTAAISREAFLAEVLNSLELVVDQYQAGQQETLLRLYYEYWLHGGQEVEVQQKGSGTSRKAVVVGVDSYGYLVVRTAGTGERVAVHPDGNSFDMMRNLVRPKF